MERCLVAKVAVRSLELCSVAREAVGAGCRFLIGLKLRRGSHNARSQYEMAVSVAISKSEAVLFVPSRRACTRRMPPSRNPDPPSTPGPAPAPAAERQLATLAAMCEGFEA
jgi:hypothetical protein